MASTKTIVTMICITLISLVAVGCSDDSSPVTTAPVDTAPPAVPAEVSVDYDRAANAAHVSWAANTTDADLAGYVVSRDYYGDVDVLVASPAMINSYQDSAPLLGISTYHVYAVDEAGNQSAVASCQLVRTSSHATHDLGQ